MHKTQYYISIALSGLVLALAIAVIGTSLVNRNLSEDLGKQQVEINRGQLSQQIGTALLRDMAVASVNDSQIKDLMAKHGYNVNVKPKAQP